MIIFPLHYILIFQIVIFDLNDTIRELKCTAKLQIEHKIQLIIYAWLWQTLKNPKKQIKLLNIFTGEIWILHLNYQQLTDIVIHILRGKYSMIPLKSNTEFLDFGAKIIAQTDINSKMICDI